MDMVEDPSGAGSNTGGKRGASAVSDQLLSLSPQKRNQHQKVGSQNSKTGNESASKMNNNAP